MQRPALSASRWAKDAALAARVIAQPDESILAAWRRFGPLVRWTLVKMLGPDEDVRDLSQEAFLQLHRSVRTLRSPQAIRQFVAGIAVRLALHELRRRRVRDRQVLVPGQGLVPPSSTTPDPEAREVIASLLGMVGRLRGPDREMFLLRQLQGLDQAEICAVTGMSISTVRRRLRRLERRIAILVRTEPALAAYAERATGRAPTGRSASAARA